MRKFFNQPTIDNDKVINKLELLFTKSFVQVTPRTEFVHELKKRLATYQLPETRQDYLHWSVFAAASLISGIMLLVMGIRSVIMVLSTLGIISHYRQTLQQKRTSELTPLS
jgi:hypothetical protein